MAQFLHQSPILKSDDYLIGKVFHQLNLLLGKFPYLLTVDDDAAGYMVLPKHRYCEERPNPRQLNALDRKRIAF